MSGRALDDTRVHLVDSMDELDACRRWASGQLAGTLCADTESAGFKPHTDAHRLTQIGDMRHGWAFPPGWFGAANQILARYPGRIGYFNSAYDMQVFAAQDGLHLDWARVDDAQLAGHIADSVRVNALKPRASIEIDSRANQGEKLLKEGMRKQGWTWATVPVDFQPYWCVPDDTEILTRDGWKKHDQVAEGDETLGYLDGHLEWTEISDVARFEDAPLVRIGNRYWSTECTPDHRWLIEKTGNLALRPLADSWKTKDTTRLVLSAPAVGGTSGLTPGEASVLAWVLSDGHVHWQRPDTQTSPIAEIVQSEHKYVDEIRALLQSEHAYVSERPHSTDCVRFYVKSGYFQRVWDKSGLRDHDMNHLVMSLSAETRRAWLDTWLMAEGTTGKNVITQNRGQKLDALALCIYLEGMTPLITSHGDRCARIRLSSRRPTPQKTKITDAGRGRVWCPVTGLHTWTARDCNGNIYVTGNTYGALDPVLTSHLIEKFRPAVAQAPAAYDLELAYARLCANMMTAGMMIDIPYINERISEITAWNAGATRWLRDVWGVTSVRSAEQVEHALNRAGVPTLVRTPTGQAATDKDTMAMYQAAYPHAAELITTMRGAKKADDIIGKCLSKFLALASPDGVMHYSIHGTGAQRTGRSSVTDPPMQTFDRDVPIIRGSYVPRTGNAFVTIDADQIEARLAAHFSGDRQMIADFLEADRMGASFFLIMASRIYGREITKKDPRYTTTKNATYAQIYGSGLDTAAATAGVTIEQMRPAYEGMNRMYPGLKRMMNQLVSSNRGRHGHRPQVKTISGKTLFADRGKEYALTDYCLGPQTPVLHADLTWRPAGETRKGDQLVGFDEHSPGQVPGMTPRRQMRTADVEVVSMIEKQSVIVHTDQGPVTCSNDHLWLVNRRRNVWVEGKRTQRGQDWCAADDLRPGDKIMTIGRPWQPSMGYTAGWLAGIFDGEGTLSMRTCDGHPSMAMNQNPGAVLGKTIDALASMEIPISVYPSSGTTTCVKVSGGPFQIMRALGILQPVRWRDKYRRVWEGRDLPRSRATVLEIEQIGIAELAAIQTSTRTLIADGLLSHNCIQGSAAEIMKFGGIALDAAGLGPYLRLSIHDEWLLECPAAEADGVLREATRILTDRTSFSVPLTWSGSILRERWAKT